jgi:hypothetical protein
MHAVTQLSGRDNLHVRTSCLWPIHKLASHMLTPATRLYEVYPVVQMPYQQRAEGYVALGAYIDGDNASSTKFCYSQPVVMKYLPSVSSSHEVPAMCGCPTVPPWQPSMAAQHDTGYIRPVCSSTPALLCTRCPTSATSATATQANLRSSLPSHLLMAQPLPPWCLQGQKLMQMYVGAPRGQQASAALPVSELPAPSDGQVQLGVSGGELVAVHKFEGYITPQAAAAARQKLVDALLKGGAADTIGLAALMLWWVCTAGCLAGCSQGHTSAAASAVLQECCTCLMKQAACWVAVPSMQRVTACCTLHSHSASAAHSNHWAAMHSHPPVCSIALTCPPHPCCRWRQPSRRGGGGSVQGGAVRGGVPAGGEAERDAAAYQGVSRQRRGTGSIASQREGGGRGGCALTVVTVELA